MKTQQIDSHSLLLFLEKGEPESLKLDIYNLQMSDERTRLTLKTLFKKASEQVGFKPDKTSSALVEMLPFEDGSCLLVFSFPEKNERLKIVARPLRREAVYEFESKDALFDYRRVSGSELSCVYEFGGVYRAFICEKDESAKSLLSEYARLLTGTLEKGTTEEFWNKINIREDAL